MVDIPGLERNTYTGKHAFRYGLKILFSVLFMQRVFYYHKVKEFLTLSFKILLVYVLIMDASVMSSPSDDGSSAVIWGGKFIVSYTNLFLVTIYYLLHPNLELRYKKRFLSLIFLSIVVTSYSSCTTVTFTLIIFAIMALQHKIKNIKWLYKPLFFVFILLICDSLLFFFSTWLLSYDVVQDFIVNVLNKDLTLTGRLNIYNKIVDIFQESPWIGSGIGNFNVISVFLTGCENAQNGLVNLYIELGFIGCIIVIAWIGNLLRMIKPLDFSVYPIIAFLYVEIIISMVEIPFSYTFFYFMTSLLILYTKMPNTYCNNKNIYLYSK